MRVLRYLAGGVITFLVAVPVFERVAPYWLIKRYWKVVNPVFEAAAGRVPGLVLLETTGRRTGLARRVPVGGRLDGDVLWVVIAHTRNNASLKNLRANPNVRVRVGGRWREGIATVVEHDDARRRAVRINPVNGLFLAMATSDQVSVRVGLSS